MSTIRGLTIENKLERQTKELPVNENRTILDTIDKLTQIEHLYQDLMKFDLEDVFTVHESQIEKLKKSNEEMFKKIRDETVRDKVIEMLDELRNAEAELRKRKVYIEVEYRNTACKVEQLKERINKAMRDFEIAVDNSTKNLQRYLQSNRKELEAIEKEIKFGSQNTLVYEKVKNILLQQEVVLVKGMYSTRQGKNYQVT